MSLCSEVISSFFVIFAVFAEKYLKKYINTKITRSIWYVFKYLSMSICYNAGHCFAFVLFVLFSMQI